MSESPIKKKPKISTNESKRKTENESSSRKRNCRTDSENSNEHNIVAKKKKNFIKSCEQVSYEAYYDYRKRFILLMVPNCIQGSCKHLDQKKQPSPIPNHIEEAFKIEFTTQTWYEALDICRICIKQKQYLSANILKDVIEIILNSHEDVYSSYSLPYVLDKCRQLLSFSFQRNAPCSSKTIRKCYNLFLTSPMDLKENTFSNRSEFLCDKGIVKYCWNRLSDEMKSETKEGPIFDKADYTPMEMKQNVKGLFWKKQKFEIYETLTRSNRIERLLLVLDSVIELLQLDLAIWHSRHTNNQGRNIMRSHRPLMASVLWSDNILYTGAVNNNCRQIMKFFVDFICLDYPEHHIKTLTLWMNIMIQTFYICETNSNCDFPNIGKYSMKFANEFHKLIKDLPTKLLLKVLKTIQPTYMRYLLGVIHLKEILATKNDDILKITLEFLNKATWTKFSQSDEEIPNLHSHKETCSLKLKKLYPYLTNICKEKLVKFQTEMKENQFSYPKQNPNLIYDGIDRSEVIMLLFFTLEAYLDAFSVNNVQTTLETMNSSLNENIDMDSDSNSSSNVDTLSKRDYSYTITEHFIKKYRSIYQLLQEIVLLFSKLKKENKWCDQLKIFKNIKILGL